jgi:hypothetical protein
MSAFTALLKGPAHGFGPPMLGQIVRNKNAAAGASAKFSVVLSQNNLRFSLEGR